MNRPGPTLTIYTGWRDCAAVALFFFFSSRRRHTRLQGDWSSDVCSSDLKEARRRRGEPPVTTLWPWGAQGRAVQPERRAARATPRAFGADPYVSGLWRLQADLCRALPGRLEDEIGRASCRERV